MHRLRKFKFKGVDDGGVPKIKDEHNRSIEPQERGPENAELITTIEVYHENPTWVKIGGRWYRIG